jgi:small-conductance mechanosensitive channel
VARRSCGRVAAAALAVLWGAGLAVPRPLHAAGPLGVPLHAPQAAAAPTPIAPTAQPSPPAEPPTIAVPDIASRAEELSTFLRQVETGLAPSPQLKAIEDDLPELSERDADLLADLDRTLEQGPQLHVLQALISLWTRTRNDIAASNALLTDQAKRLEDLVGELSRRRELWRRTQDEARASGAPAPVLDRVQETLAAIYATQKSVDKRRAEILAMQDKLTRELALVDDAVSRLNAYRQTTVGKILVRDSHPLWAMDFSGRSRVRILSHVANDLRSDARDFRDYVANNGPRIALQLLLLLVLIALFRGGRTRARRIVEREPTLEPATRVFQLPYSSALVLTALSTLWIHSALPQMPLQGVALLALVPVLRVVRPYTHPGFVRGLYAFAGFYVTDRIRFFCSASPLLEQLIFLVEMAAGGILIAWLLRPARLDKVELNESEIRALRQIGIALRVLLLAFVVSFLAGAFGFMQLGRLLGGGALIAVYGGLVLYASVRASQGLVTYGLRTRPLRRLRMVEGSRELIERRVNRTLVVAAAVAWLCLLVVRLQLASPTLSLAQSILALPIAPPVTIGNLLAFVLAVVGAWLVSRFVRFVVREDVLPQFSLPRGVDYAITSILTYVLLLGGFVYALSFLGVDLNRASLLAGAFGVGIGFGLQNVVNNFVSGLILLFERPIQVGDTVQIGGLTGVVNRIGIRSSTVRTAQGSEVIVPNGSLISDPVTNWTLSDRMRRIDLSLGVAYGSDPERVLALLVEIAQAHPNVLPLPPPTALFRGFGPSTLDFEMSAWTNQPDGWVQVRSELGISLYRRLQAEGIEIPYPQLQVRSVDKA